MAAYQCNSKGHQDAAVSCVPKEGNPDPVLPWSVKNFLNELVLPLKHGPHRLPHADSDYARDDASADGD
jgi:hypothetical protein